MNREKILTFFVSIVLLGACGARETIKELTEPSGQLFVKHNLCKGDSKLKDGLSLPELLEKVRASHSKKETGLHLLEDGGGALAARGWLTRKALQSIDIQYFIFSSDQVGLIALQELINAAQRGVKVRLLVDDLLHHGDAQILLAADSVENLDIRIYNPTINIGRSLTNKLVKVATDFRAVNQRMHNKTFIVDDEIVITGGRNVADEYFDFSLEYNFRDRDLLMIQGATAQVKQSFDTFWDHRLSVKLSDLLDQQSTTLITKVLRQLKHLSCDPHRFWPEVQQRIANIPVRFLQLREQGYLTWVKEVEFVSDLPGKNDGSQGLGGGGLSTDALIKLVDEATESIYIQTPYLVTTDLGKGLFKRAVDRGVKVKILTNSLSTTDSFPAFASYRSDREALVKLGIEVYESKPHNEAWSKMMTSELTQRLSSLAMLPMVGLHAKSMVIDGQTIMVGTFNLDPRSANLNTECIVIAHDQTQAQRLQEIMVREINDQNAWRIKLGSDPDHHAPFSNRWYAFWSWLVPKEVI